MPKIKLFFLILVVAGCGSTHPSAADRAARSTKTDLVWFVNLTMADSPEQANRMARIAIEGLCTGLTKDPHAYRRTEIVFAATENVYGVVQSRYPIEPPRADMNACVNHLAGTMGASGAVSWISPRDKGFERVHADGMVSIMHKYLTSERWERTEAVGARGRTYVFGYVDKDHMMPWMGNVCDLPPEARLFGFALRDLQAMGRSDALTLLIVRLKKSGDEPEQSMPRAISTVVRGWEISLSPAEAANLSALRIKLRELLAEL